MVGCRSLVTVLALLRLVALFGGMLVDLNHVTLSPVYGSVRGKVLTCLSYCSWEPINIAVNGLGVADYPLKQALSEILEIRSMLACVSSILQKWTYYFSHVQMHTCTCILFSTEPNAI